MIITSSQFFFFFTAVILLYFLLPPKYQWIVLLAANCVFYASWKTEYLFILAATTIFVYYAGILVANTDLKARKKYYLAGGITACLLVLIIFKYIDFIGSSFNDFFTLIHIDYSIPEFRLLFPLGISFYTFQVLSYLVDIYKGRIKPEKHFGIFAVYLSFFPQIVSGPIARSEQLLPQFHSGYRFNSANFTTGAYYVLLGIFKKVVIADRLAFYIDTIYQHPAGYSGVSLLIAAYFFAFQIFCDFSGYSDIAIGIAKVLNKDLMINFKQPYFAKSVREFWQRWHISLSTWFRDYLFFPLGGALGNKYKQLRNVIVTFTLSGLWHGADWTFIVWGLLHGILIIFSAWSEYLRRNIVRLLGLRYRSKILNYFRVVLTFHIILVTWIFFRANSVADAFLIIHKISQLILSPQLWLDVLNLSAPFQSHVDLLFIGILIASMIVFDWIVYVRKRALDNFYFKVIFASVLFWAILIFGKFNNQQFIYSQF